MNGQEGLVTLTARDTCVCCTWSCMHCRASDSNDDTSHLKLLPPKLASTCTPLVAIVTAAGVCPPKFDGRESWLQHKA